MMQVTQEVRAILLSHGRLMRVRKGQIVVSVGLPATDVFLVVEGQVAVSLLSSAGRETLLRTIGPDELFGEMAVIDGEARSADVVALENGVLSAIPGDRFAGLIGNDPAVSLWLAQFLCRQVRTLTGKVYELSNLTVSSRLLSEIRRLANGSGTGSGAAVIARPPTHAEMAARIGTNRETVTRELGHLLRQGLIARQGRSIVIPSLEQLDAELRHLSPTA